MKLDVRCCRRVMHVDEMGALRAEVVGEEEGRKRNEGVVRGLL